MEPMIRPAVALTATVLLLAGLAAPATASPPEAPTHLIQISLLLASKSGPSDLADLPANTRQAIEDIRGFLPFKSYRLLDTGLVRSSRHAHTKLRGPGGGEFLAAINLRPDSAPGKVMVNSFELIERLRYDSPQPPGSPAGGGEKAAAPSAPRAATQQVMSSSFSADIGQTVVVGSSRLNGGDEALVVLFTALP